MLNSNSIGLLFKLNGDSKDAQNASRELKSQIEKDAKSIENDLEKAGSGAKATGGAFSSFIGNIAADAVLTLTQYLKDGAKAVLDYSSKIEQAQIKFQSLTGSVEKASLLLKEIQTLAKNTPFEFEGLSNLATRLLGANVELEKIPGLLKDVGNIVAATGETSQERLEGVGTALSQIIQKTRFSAEEAEQMAERSVPIWNILAQATGKNVAELRKLSEQGAITSDVVVASLQKISKEKYGDAMAKQAQTFAGSTTVIKESILQIAAESFKPIYEEISQFTSRFAKNLQNQESAAKGIAYNFGKSLGESYLQGFSSGKMSEDTKNSLIKFLTLGIGGYFLTDVIKGAANAQVQQPSIADLRKSDDTNRIGTQTQDFIKIGENAEKQRKEREETAKRDTAALIKIWQDYLSEVNTSFDDVFKKIEERFKETGNAEEFRANLEQIVNIYKDKAFEANGALLNLERLQSEQLKKTKGEQLALTSEQNDRMTAIEKKYVDARAEAEKQITDGTKKQSEERVKQTEQEINRQLSLSKSFVDRKLKELEYALKQETISEEFYVKKSGEYKLAMLEHEKKKVQELIVTKENQQDIELQLRLLDDQIAVQKLENSEAILDYEKRRNDSLLERIEKTFLLLELERKLKEEYTAPAGGAEPPSDTPGIGDVDIQPGGFWGIIDRMEEMLENETPLKLADQFRAMGEIVSNAFLDISNAIGNVLTDWILYGETGPAVMRKILASALASIAAEAAVRAIYATALGFLRLAQWDFAGAASAFTSAAIWASIAGVTAITGRAIAGDAFRRETSGAFGGSSAGSSGSSQSRDAQIIESGRNAPAGSFLQISIKDKPDWFEDMFVVSLRQNGRIRQEILNLQNV